MKGSAKRGNQMKLVVSPQWTSFVVTNASGRDPLGMSRLQCRWRRNGVTVGGAEMAAWVRERTRSCPGRRAGATLA